MMVLICDCTPKFSRSSYENLVRTKADNIMSPTHLCKLHFQPSLFILENRYCSRSYSRSWFQSLPPHVFTRLLLRLLFRTRLQNDSMQNVDILPRIVSVKHVFAARLWPYLSPLSQYKLIVTYCHCRLILVRDYVEYIARYVKFFLTPQRKAFFEFFEAEPW